MELEAALVLASEETLASFPARADAWRALLPRARLATAAGGHFSMLDAPHVDALARTLDAALRETTEP